MIINSIHLSDFGPYGGTQALVLHKEGSKKTKGNIILIGGMNGAGKSSIFRAIQICLYGQAALGPITSRRAYEQCLRNLVHQGSSPVEISQASVAVDFTISLGGERANYVVIRKWNIKTAALTEFVEVTKNGVPIDGHEQRYWQDFIQHLIPQGLLNLFFFDGERISAFTQSDESSQLGESIQALFGLNVVRQLRTDLRYIERKWIDHSGGDVELGKLIDTKEKLLATDSDALIKLIEKKAALVAQQENLSTRLLDWRRKLNRKGGSSGPGPEWLQETIQSSNRAIQETSATLKQLFQGALPFIFAKEYLGYTLSRLSETASETATRSYAAQFNANWNKAQVELRKLVVPPKSLSQLKDLLCPPPDVIVKEQSSDLSAATIKDVRQWFQDDAQDSLIEACALIEKIEALTRERDGAQTLLESVPENADISLEIDQVNLISRELGAVESQILATEREIDVLKDEITALEKDCERHRVLLDERGVGNRKTALTAKSILALASFEKKLIETKIGILENNFVVCFNQLMRKGDVISAIQIDPTNFSLKLVGAGGREVHRAQLSEGEKQIFAIALLHAITRTSKCPFPIIIDTPLGRLDSEHKKNIVNFYLPNASHQVIVLSTDTEVDRQLHAELGDNIQKSFLLHFDHKQRRTEIRDGYFKFAGNKYESIAG